MIMIFAYVDDACLNWGRFLRGVVFIPGYIIYNIFFLLSDVVPSEQIIDIGRQARLECLTEEKDRASISWRKDGKPLPGHDRVVDSGRVLQIYNLQRDDYGMYQCFVRRDRRHCGGGGGSGSGIRCQDREEAQAGSELRLGDAAPTFTYRFIDQTLQPGPLVSLKCAARGSPTPRIRWTVDGFDLPRSDQRWGGYTFISWANIRQSSLTHFHSLVQ